MVGDANLFHRGKIDNANIEVARVNGARFDVVFHVLGKPGENKLKAGAARLRLHGDLFPFRGALIAGVEAHFVGLHADGLRGDQLVGVAANGASPGVTRMS